MSERVFPFSFDAQTPSFVVLLLSEHACSVLHDKGDMGYPIRDGYLLNRFDPLIHQRLRRRRRDSLSTHQHERNVRWAWKLHRELHCKQWLNIGVNLLLVEWHCWLMINHLRVTRLFTFWRWRSRAFCLSCSSQSSCPNFAPMGDNRLEEEFPLRFIVMLVTVIFILSVENVPFFVIWHEPCIILFSQLRSSFTKWRRKKLSKQHIFCRPDWTALEKNILTLDGNKIFSTGRIRSEC